MKILIALDDSPHTDRVLDFVTHMRWPAGSRVIVLSALQPATMPVGVTADVAHTLPDLLKEQRQRLEDVVSRAESTLRESGFATEGRVLTGDPREALLHVAQSERADLIVVGSRGRTGLAKLMLGSVSSHVVTHAPCSVLVVKQAVRTAGEGKEKSS
jgi:nucleotide-binding universal stress UspA family protein